MAGEFLGSGWRFPVQVDEDGRVIRSADEDAIRQSIWIILGTARGERVMRPDFGCGIHDLVFAVGGTGTAGSVAADVREALVRWEPRIDVLDVAVTAPPGQAATLLIRIEYRVRTTNNVFNLVYPFYLEGVES